MTPKPITENTLFYGDNLPILREYIPDESVDLVYLDPPFNSKRTYNVLFQDESGLDSEAQIAAFDDFWHWDRAAEETYHELVTQGPEHVSRMIAALREFIGANQMMAYLVMMAARLVELHRVLKPTGSLYLHCDPTASHYLKIVLDAIFGVMNYCNEVTWKRSSAHLAALNRFQFEWWALSLVRARPTGGRKGSRRGKKGADLGIDGVITFIDEAKGQPKRVLVQVKSGKVGSRDIRDLRGAVERDKAAMGAFITLEDPTGAMKKEALTAGFYHSPGWQKDYPRIQILTVEELLEGAAVEMPPAWGTFKRAPQVKEPEGVQAELGI